MKSMEMALKQIRSSSINIRLILLGLVGIILMVTGGFLSRDGNNEKNMVRESDRINIIKSPAVRSYEENLEARLANLLSQVKGAGAVGVHISLENNGLQENAQNLVKESKTVQEKDNNGGIRTTTETKESVQVLLSKKDGIDKPIVIKEIKPIIRGVLIIAEGASDSIVKSNLIKAVEYGLGIPAYRITVLPQRR